MSKLVIGKVKKQQEDLKGWLVGQFLSGGPFRDKNVEIYYKTFPKGDKSDKLHKHPQGREYLKLVVSGKAIMRVGDEQLKLEAGDYIAIPNETPDKLMEVLEDFTIIGVRYPSIPNNKILLED